MVIATQNPIEQEGTYPLPEAQLDRFLLQIDVGYPDLDAERRMLLATTIGEEKNAARVCTPDDLLEAQVLVRRIPVGEQVMDSILTLVRAARPDSDHDGGLKGMIAWGPGPRASQALMLAVRARALLDGRLAPSTDGVVALAGPVLRRRMARESARLVRPAAPASAQFVATPAPPHASSDIWHLRVQFPLGLILARRTLRSVAIPTAGLA